MLTDLCVMFFALIKMFAEGAVILGALFVIVSVVYNLCRRFMWWLRVGSQRVKPAKHRGW